MSVRAAVLFSFLLAACFVDRPSQSFECTTSATCTNGRVCKSGYCVEPMCPSDCTSCDEDKQTCIVECTSGDDCGNVNCPNGWTCNINCVGGGACNDINCASGSKCNITCTGDSACQDISCRDACSCDLQCVGDFACDTYSCPGNGANRCSVDGTTDTPCDSSPAGCTKC